MSKTVKSVEFLPEIFKTDTNRQFLSATLDVLTSQPTMSRVEGFIGNKYGYGVTPYDKYVTESSASRRNYQLDPSVIFLKPDTQKAQDFINYPGILQSLKNQGANITDNSRLFEAEFYSWDPFIDYDKIVNYAQYYWIPQGPDSIVVTVNGDINELVVGQSTFTSVNGINLINGLKITFDGSYSPSSYNGEYYIDGVGSSIVLLPVTSFVTPETDITSADYITISRNSDDYNAWTRSNRWFHQSVLDLTTSILGVVTTASSNTITRAQRPIVEFRGNLQLFNSGIVATEPVTLIDSSSTDALATIPGNSSYTIDGISLSDGDTIIFAADTSLSVRQAIWKVSIVPAGPSATNVITLVQTDSVVEDQTQTCVLEGNSYQGTSWRFDSITGNWIQSQQKNSNNQAPLFDIFDINGISYGNTEVYIASTFQGTKLFSYTIGTGLNDPILGFPIKYSSVTNIGDITFTVNMNSDSFSYKNSSNQIITKNINSGYVHENTSSTSWDNLTGWILAAGSSFQSQVLEFTTTESTTQFVCDIPAVSSLETAWSTVEVFVNDEIIDDTAFSYSVDLTNGTTTVTLASAVGADTKVTILIYSNQISKTGYYEIPSNLQNNPFNTNITTVDVGDIRNQYRSIYSNAPGVIGPVFGNNNINNLGSVNQYGTNIIQNSASLVLPGLFLRKSTINFFDALRFNRDQYTVYKNTIIDLAGYNDYSIYQTPSEVLDSIIYQIASTKSNSEMFFWTDTLYSGSPYAVNNYTFGSTPLSEIFTLSRVYVTDQANYYAVALYITRNIDGISTQFQLIRDRDYTVSQITNTVTVTFPIMAGDTLTIKEYNQTYGSYCPSTPSSLGLYPAYIPEVIYDISYTTPTYMLRGHDGSLTKLYGNYTNGRLDDFRDIALLEFETRIYNNIKTSGQIPLVSDEVIPGQFRQTDYSNNEILQIYSPEFLNWTGSNRIDFRTQYYSLSNPFSYNYNESSNKLSNNVIEQGYWRGIYRWLYDTDTPNTTPWEMLGFTVKPDWWQERYGAAPYTSGNTTLWTDIANGYIWNNGAPYVNSRKIRSQLLEILPVNSAGELLDPMITIVGNYNKLTFNRDWNVGDEAPAESSYLKSSSWPFDLMRLLALTKPTKFFNLFVDLDQYKFNSDFQQYLYNERDHLNPLTLEIYGAGTAKNSYINWIVDWVNVSNVNGHNVVTEYIQNLDVRLTYSLAGFSSKNYLRFYIERATPNSKNTSFLIPDESYSVLLYDNVPEEIVTYSNVIIQKDKLGWRVWGNSVNKQYFTTSVSKQNGTYKNIKINSVTVQLSNDWYDSTVDVPYGTLFYSYQALCEFLNNYGRYLSTQGVVFETIDNGVVLDWDRIIQEYLAWAQQSWEVGSIIAVNPSARYFTINRPGLIVQPTNINNQNFILNQNLVPIQNQNCSIIRENESFNIKVLNAGDTVSYTNLNLNSIEHAVVFDNTTAFNDIIYNLTTGLRQPRLLLKGNKTGEWTGFVNSNGFILNEDNIREWDGSKKYAKGQIVLYKNLYWVASTLIEPSSEFDITQWFKIDYDQIKLGLLSNPSTNAYESLYYYDVNRANLELDADLLSYSLIGYRSRAYLASADLSDVTQINVYKNIVREKGTKLLAEGFKNAEFDQGAIDYNISENWAINTGSFGKILDSNFLDVRLIQNQLTGNPTLIGFVNDDSSTINDTNQTVSITDLLNWERPPQTADFLPKYEADYTISNGLPSAGYVDYRDAKFRVFEYLDLNDDSTNITSLRANDIVWVAKYKNSWNIFSAKPLENQVVEIQNNLNGTVTVTFSAAHKLSALDPIAIANFSDSLNGFYIVESIQSIYSLTVSLVLDNTIIKQSGTGVIFKFESRRFFQPSDIVPINNYNESYMSWVDRSTDENWAVWANSPVWTEQIPTVTQTVDLGSSVAYSSILGLIVGDSSQSRVYIEKSNTVATLSGPTGFGKKIIVLDNALYVASNNSVTYYEINSLGNLEYVQEIIVLPSTGILSSFAVSSDNKWLYISKELSEEIEVRHLNQLTSQYDPSAFVITAPESGIGWGQSIACSTDGRRLLVSAPLEDVNDISDAGTVYVYARAYRNFTGDGTTTTYTVDGTLSANQFDVTVNGVSTSDYSIIGLYTIEFITAPNQGDIVNISYSTMSLLQKISSDSTRIGAKFGNSLDTNRFGAVMCIGSPYDITILNDNVNAEGSVSVYINSGQKYGNITLSNPSVTSGDKIYINGWEVNFSISTNNATTIAGIISNSAVPNIVATAVNNSVFINIVADNIVTPGNIIDLIADIIVSDSLNYSSYTRTQKIYNSASTNVGEFGNSLKMNERDGLIVGSPTADSIRATTFDFTLDCQENDTIFDNAATYFNEAFQNVGSVIEYNYLEAYEESISNPGKYIHGQNLNTSNQNYGYQPRFGTSLAYRDEVIVVGNPDWTSPQRLGYVTTFRTDINTDACSIGQTQSWYIDKVPCSQVNVNKLNNIAIYDITSNKTLGYLDYIDPAQGKLFGAISTNLDFIATADPAGYSGDNQQWGPEQIGKTWLDISNLRLYNYSQPDHKYNMTYWGKTFPGSTADISTWIESSVSPLDYAGTGFPTNYESYVTRLVFNTDINNIEMKYYFWVKNYNQIPEGKTLSPIVVSSYILNPISSGISFLTASTGTDTSGNNVNIIGLYNCSEYIADYSSAVHIGYGNGIYQDNKHSVWALIKTNDADSFLSGFPTIPGQAPTNLYLKYIDSFSGVDNNYLDVPDSRLPALVQSGVNFNPRQTMFINRTLALENYIEYANAIAIKEPVVETKNLSLLESYNIIENLVRLNSVITATTEALFAYYNNGDSGYGATLQGVGSLPGIGGVTPSVGDRILIKDQSDAIQNGVYTVTVLAPNWILTRSTDFDNDTISAGLTVTVSSGLLVNTEWTLTTAGTIIIGLSDLIFTKTAVGPTYDTRDYWTYADWWAEGYDSNIKPTIEVNNYLELQTLTSGNLIVGLEGLTIIKDGLIAKVKLNSYGLSEIYIYSIDSSTNTGTWTRIGVLNGTVQFNNSLWENTYGWDTDVWDSSPYNETQYIPIRNIIRWINEELYTGSSLAERNNSLILAFEVIQGQNPEQNNYNSWLTKTSLISVNHRIRSLLEYKKYQRDNQEFLSGYLNEIKPYHVVIKDLIYSYNGTDVYSGNVTDFDLPAEWNAEIGKFQSPQLIYNPPIEDNQYLPNNAIWTTTDYSSWFDNFGLSIGTTIGNDSGPSSIVMLNDDFTEITKLTYSIDAVQNYAYVDSFYGLENNGTIYIDSEQITYTTVDRVNKKIIGMIRGANGTTATSHAAQSIVSVISKPIIVLDTSNTYTSAPQVTVSYDSVTYPTPRANASFSAILSSNTVSSIVINNTGSGYVTVPTINVANAGTISFSNTAINTANNTITVASPPETGSCVQFNSSTSALFGLNNQSYYYVRKTSVNTIALYKTYADSIAPWIGVTTLASSINSSNTTIIVTDPNALPNLVNTIQIDDEYITYTGINYSTNTLVGVTRGTGATAHSANTPIKVLSTKYTTLDTERVTLNSNTAATGILSLATRIQTNTQAFPTRNINTKLRFNRVTYTDTGEINTAANNIVQYYQPTANMSGLDLPQLMSGIEYPNSIAQGQDFNAGTGWDQFGWDSEGTLPWDGAGDADQFLDSQFVGPVFTSTVPSLYTLSGGPFADGYAPEELVGGIITDSLAITVISNDATLSFRQLVNRSSEQVTYNSNPFTQTTLLSNLTDSSTQITVGNANTVVTSEFTQSGSLIYIAGEYIRFTTVDYANNIIGGLQRGIGGTIVNTNISGGVKSATNLTPGILYKIVSVGSTDFTVAGAGTNTVNTVFVANQNALTLTGTGTVVPIIQSMSNARRLPQQYQNYWWYSPAAIVFGTISGTTLTVTSVVNGTLAVGQKITAYDSASATNISATISGFIGGSGGVGTYQISVSYGSLSGNSLLINSYASSTLANNTGVIAQFLKQTS